jgi:NAD(P)-dependent dehydrogenase (short-subunit alcohol dehydrogenase family)
VAAELAQKVALITGVAREGQIGAAVARAFGRAGARLVIADRDAAGLAARAAELAAQGFDVRPVSGDLTSRETAARAVATAQRELGGLDVVVNVAGGLTSYGPFLGITAEALERELTINLKTAWHVCQAAVPALIARGGGAIVNFASIAWVRPAEQLAAYAAAKAAVAGLTQALAREFREHFIRVNALAPSAVRTGTNVQDMGPAPATPFVEIDELVRVVLFLASDDARGISGQIVPVTGPGGAL